MYFDALTLAAVADEMETVLLGGRIQHICLPNQHSIALEIYHHGRRHHLLLSAHPQLTRVHLSTIKPSRGVDTETPLLLLLRKYVVGGRIVGIEQPALERILALSIAKGPFDRNIDDLSPEEEQQDHITRCEIIIETMERRANILLVGDDNIIMESMRHITPTMSRRPVQPREPYELPPAQQKRDPRQATSEGIHTLLTGNERNLARALVAAYRGLSPIAAREAVFRATGQTECTLAPDLPWATIADALRTLWKQPWQPCLVTDHTGPLAYAPYALTHHPSWAPLPTICTALDQFYTTHEQLGAHQQRRDHLRQQLLDTRERIDRQRRLIHEELEHAKERDRLRWEGEMIYGFLHTLTPGQSELDIEGQRITLDPKLTPIENAQARFHAYDKAKSAQAGLPTRLRTTELQLTGLDETLALLALAEGYGEIESIAREAIAQGYLRPEKNGKQPKPPRSSPLRIESSDGFTIYIGRSAGQNEIVTFKIATADDLWLHARDIPGAHVIIKSAGRIVPERTLREAGELAAYFSAGRTETGVDIIVTRRSLVRRIPNSPPGLVTYRAEQSLRVSPRKPT